MSFKHKKIIFMDSTEKEAKSFCLRNNSGNKRAVTVSKKPYHNCIYEHRNFIKHKHLNFTS